MAAAVVPASSSQVSDPVPLEGEYQLGGSLDHNGAIFPGRSHLYVSISGDAAQILYQSLDGDPLDDVCTGYKVKGRGNIACYEIAPEEQHFCTFSINLERSVVEAGLGGCF